MKNKKIICSNDISILIKTFERKEALIKLLSSIRSLGFIYPILIADDSRISYKNEILEMYPDLNIQYFILPFDCGLSFGRNYLVNQTKTDYFVLCDDDFVFDKKTNIERAREILIRENVDILSGVLFNYIKQRNYKDCIPAVLQKKLGLGFIQTYVGNMTINKGTVKVDIKTRVRKGFVRSDLVHNFFIAKKSAIVKMGGWDPELKLSEHGEFFLRAKKFGLKIGHSGCWSTRHYPIISANYQTYRKRDYDMELFNKHQLDLWVDIVDNGSTFIRKRCGDQIILKRVFHKNPRGLIRFIYNKLRH